METGNSENCNGDADEARGSLDASPLCMNVPAIGGSSQISTNVTWSLSLKFAAPATADAHAD